MLNGNTGVMKSVIAGQPSLLESLHSHRTDVRGIELTDSTNMAQGFACIPVSWAIGATMAYVFSQTFLPLLRSLYVQKTHDWWAACEAGRPLAAHLHASILEGVPILPSLRSVRRVLWFLLSHDGDLLQGGMLPSSASPLHMIMSSSRHSKGAAVRERPVLSPPTGLARGLPAT